MGDTIILPNGQRVLVSNDSDFLRLLRGQLGEDAADWFMERIYRVEEQMAKIRPHIQKCKIDHAKFPYLAEAYDYTLIENLPHETLVEIAADAFEIPGWDE